MNLLSGSWSEQPPDAFELSCPKCEYSEDMDYDKGYDLMMKMTDDFYRKAKEKRKPFIKMCEKAEKIQKLWVPIIGDLTDMGIVLDIYRDNGVLKISYTRNFQHHDTVQNHPKAYLVWLPRQDQLQKLTGIVSIPTLLSQFNEFVFENVKYASYFIDSCEMLWLAFVMKKRYNKTWNEGEWM